MAAAVTIRIQEADFDIGREISALTKGAYRYRRRREFFRHLPGQRGR